MRNFLFFLWLIPALSCAQLQVSHDKGNGNHFFPIAGETRPATILYDAADDALVKRSAEFLAGDIEKVTGRKPELEVISGRTPGKQVILVATPGNNPLVDQLIASGKLEVEAIRGQWERYIIQTVDDPFPGVTQALVIVGSDRRGTAYGVFSLSEEIGVSPWYWWADVPVKKCRELYIEKGRFVSKVPSVKYRGIFINDEAPALRGWAEETFGGFNHRFYEKVFELILRCKGNYLWPAMWVPSAFADDDPENARLADEYGIVISTSHHEPMMRAHDEWRRFDGGAWNYRTNSEQLREFWRGGIERMGDHESVVTLGMRGDGDEAMSEETAVELLQTIMADQRQIITEVTGKPADETPRAWAVYKEVQDYYDKGMRVDDDILILFCDDNWGNVRILPKKEDLGHKGGYGMYYHFDFVGGPVSYRWLNTTQIERVWEQMNLAYAWGVRDLWIVNVGDIKPMELPISFFLDFAWDRESIKAGDLPAYYIRWARQQFGEARAKEIAEILSLYTKYNARRTPESLTPETYSLENYREADRVVDGYRQLLEKSRQIYEALPGSHKSAFYQLVLSPVAYCSNLNEIYVAAAKNRRDAEQGRASANVFAEQVKVLFEKDAELTRYFHDSLENGKWNHMMSQTHIGYTSWNNPPVNIMPAVSWIQPGKGALPGFRLEHGSRNSFPPFDPVNDQSYYAEIFNRGDEPFDFTFTAREEWIKLSQPRGRVQFDARVQVGIDWEKVPGGVESGRIELQCAGEKYGLSVPLRVNVPTVSGFVENNGVVSMEAAHYTRCINAGEIRWTVIPNLGRTASSVTVEPANADRQDPGRQAPRLEYEFTLFGEAELRIETYLSPTLNYQKNEGLLYAIAVDDETPQIVNLHGEDRGNDWEYPAWWNNAVIDHIRVKRTRHGLAKPGTHTLKIWMMDPGVVFQKFVIDAGGLRPSYLGPPESLFVER